MNIIVFNIKIIIKFPTKLNNLLSNFYIIVITIFNNINEKK